MKTVLLVIVLSLCALTFVKSDPKDVIIPQITQDRLENKEYRVAVRNLSDADRMVLNDFMGCAGDLRGKFPLDFTIGDAVSFQRQFYLSTKE